MKAQFLVPVYISTHTHTHIYIYIYIYIYDIFKLLSCCVSYLAMALVKPGTYNRKITHQWNKSHKHRYELDLNPQPGGLLANSLTTELLEQNVLVKEDVRNFLNTSKVPSFNNFTWAYVQIWRHFITDHITYYNITCLCVWVCVSTLARVCPCMRAHTC